jgi:homocysteine S-methyltransferase
MSPSRQILSTAPTPTSPRYRDDLPQLYDRVFATDGGLETTLVFHDGIDLPAFAAFDLLRTAPGTAHLRAYFARYAALAHRHGLGLVLEAPTWRANRDWGARLGYHEDALQHANRAAIALMEDVRAEFANATTPIVISGNLGPRGDGYVLARTMSSDEAEAYHREQIATFADTAADMVAAFTMNYVEEAIGIVRAARACEMPVAISFTVETDGRLPSGQPLREAIEQCDSDTQQYPAYYMINCAHPTHFAQVLQRGAWLDRVRGLRANASCKSHAELDDSTELDAGNPAELGEQYRALRTTLSHLNVIGGCCGTDHRHVDAMCGALAQQEKTPGRAAV